MASLCSTAQGVDGSLSLSWHDVREAARLVAARHPDASCVYGIPSGGIAVAAFTGLPLVAPPEAAPLSPLALLEQYGRDVLVVDDLVDSGRTLHPYAAEGLRCDALFRKPHSPDTLAPHAVEVNRWLVFPWERSTGPEDAVVRLLEWIGEDPSREGLRDTPRRVVKAFREMTAGLGRDPAEVLGTVFTESCDEMVVVRGVRFSSMCEHHLLPFTGTATVGYVPDGRVVGLSKIPRLVELFARRPQLQERLTNQVASALMQHVRPRGVGVVIRAHHSCMGCRGVVQPDAEMVTSCMEGVLRDSPAARSELLALM